MVADAGVETRSHVERTVRIWLGLPASAPAPVLPRELERRFLRLEEHETDERDAWGRYDYELAESFRDGRLWEAEIDRWVAERRRELGLEPPWPNAAPFAVCLTHDVDLLSKRSTPRQIARHAGTGLERDGSVRRFARPPVRLARSLRSGVSLAPSLRETIERSVAIAAGHGLTASYLFTPPPGRNASRFDCVYAPGDACTFRGARRTVADAMRILADEGFDVGLHGSYHAGVSPGMLAEERAHLERTTGLRVASTRQHLLHWDVRTSPRLQADAGLRVDSSLGFNRNVGFRAGTSLPFRFADAPELLEIPPVLQDVSLLGSWGLELGFERAREVVREFVVNAEKTHGALTMVFHPDKLVEPDWLGLYEWTLDHVLERGAWVTSLRGLDEWWRERERRLLA
jgi:hypothetical protein